ncbi:MAG: 3-deoxy-manno-octulosonate cytidylyltransferase [Phycisphaerales bacterium]|nr:3-deoxy-manno-octulosonate cytidylyltransferase [Phycisphaerales bacterium]
MTTPDGRPDVPGGAVAIIPARMASTRFPEKVLASKTGKPLIQHVYESAVRARRTGRTVIAADDPRIVESARGFGAECILTGVHHPNGTSRLAEASSILELRPRTIVVNVQGDEPEIEGGLIDAVVDVLERSGAPVATAAAPFVPGEDASNPNIVKVVLRADSTAMYFSRSLVPYPRAGAPTAFPLKHIGIYAYRASFLQTYISLTATPLETTEMLEQLRVLEHGHAIAAAIYPVMSVGIDTPEQYEAFVARWRARQGRP